MVIGEGIFRDVRNRSKRENTEFAAGESGELRMESAFRFGKFSIDSNPAKNVIRPIALGRKNWLFAGNETGGKPLAMLAVFAATRRKNKVNYRRCLEDILVKFAATPVSELDLLLPHL